MLDGIHKIHLIGIGGSGMRAIANILIQKGYDVSGSDIAESAVISKFRDMGATVHIGHNKEYVNGVDAIVLQRFVKTILKLLPLKSKGLPFYIVLIL